jgi:hypothetical protein
LFPRDMRRRRDTSDAFSAAAAASVAAIVCATLRDTASARVSLLRTRQDGYVLLRRAALRSLRAPDTHASSKLQDIGFAPARSWYGEHVTARQAHAAEQEAQRLRSSCVPPDYVQMRARTWKSSTAVGGCARREPEG